MANYWGKNQRSLLTSQYPPVVATQQVALRPRQCRVCHVRVPLGDGEPLVLGPPMLYLPHVYPSHSGLVPVLLGDKCSGDEFTEIPETNPERKFGPPATAEAWAPESQLRGTSPFLESFTVSKGTYLSGHLAVINPPQGGKIGRLSAVESMIEAGVVAVGKGDHELPGLLRDLRKKSPTGEGG